ncbi:MAG: TetR/AcrR family transcriptional regulator [bacterium]
MNIVIDMQENRELNAEQAILEAAEKLFLEKGFAMTSTTEIAKVAGCNQSMVHYYFRTKDKLFDAIFEKKANLILSSVMKNRDKEISFNDKIKSIVESHFDLIRANSKLPFLLFNELTTNPDRLKLIVEKIQNIKGKVLPQFQKELDEEFNKGNIRKITMMDFILLLVSLNVIPFIAKPIIKAIAEMSDDEFETFIEHRKEEHVRIILKSLEK